MNTITSPQEKQGGSNSSAKLIRANKLAERLDVNKRTVELWAQRGRIPHYKIGGSLRFDESEVMASLRKGVSR